MRGETDPRGMHVDSSTGQKNTKWTKKKKEPEQQQQQQQQRFLIVSDFPGCWLARHTEVSKKSYPGFCRWPRRIE